MLEFIGFLIIVCIFGFLTLLINGIIRTGRKTPLSTELFNHEMFAEREPIVSEVPKSAVGFSLARKEFMRPRRKKV